jgi:hypothetical protein
VRGTGGGALVLGGLLAVFGDLAGLRLGLDHVQHVAGLGRAVEAQHLDRHRRPGFLHAVALVVDQRADLAPLLADDEDVALAQRAVLHQNGRDGPRPTSSCASITAPSAARRVGLEFQDLGLQRDGFEQFVEALPVMAETSTSCTSPDIASTITSCCKQVGAHLVGLASGLSILLIATIIGTPAALAWLIASTVCGITASSAATTSTTISVTCAPRAASR